MEINAIYHGFKLLSIKKIDDIGSTMYEFTHDKSGATLIYLENDDTNKCFSIGFRTLPEDSTGVCHIIEHSLLCGSKRYPTKEPFVNLLKGSMATFLNAMTAYDWTMYPVASQNDRDFDNLVSVYLDAVFAPLSVLDNKPFLQEGWHLEMHDINDTPSYKGVVYNEMKGAMSSVEEQLTQQTLASLYKGSCYEHNSGGDPDVIPNLTFEYYKDFYHKHYHPSNALMYLYGKMDVLEKLRYFNEEYLQHYEVSEPIIIEVPQARIDRDTEAYYGIGDEEDEKDNTYMSLAFALDLFENAQDLTGFGILNEVLMSNNEAPLKKLLMDAKLGQNITCSIDDDNILPSYHVYLHKTNPAEKERFYSTFLDSCKKLVEEGIDKNALLAAINHAEFRNKEMDMGRMPKGLFFAFSLMQSYNCHVPYENYLEYTKYFNYFKQELNNGYFERLLERFILNSSHYVQVVLLPSKTLASEKAKAMEAKMLALKESMSLAEKEECVRVTKELLAYQSKRDTLEELATLPKLKLSDIPSDVNKLATIEYQKSGVNFIEHNFNTNKIAYLKMYFNLNVLTYDELPYAKLISRLLGRLDTDKYVVNDLLNYVKTYLGGFSFDLMTAGINKEDYRVNLLLEVSSLNENIHKMNDVLDQVINHTIYDVDKIKIILTQLQTAYRSAIIENGTSMAIDEARSRISKVGAVTAKVSAVQMYRFLTKMLDDFNEDSISKFQEVAKKIFNINNLKASISGDDESINHLTSVVLTLPLSEVSLEPALVVDIIPKDLHALKIPSEVNYNAMVANLQDLDYAQSGKLSVINHILGYDYLWSEVRVKGGAYGCHINVSMSQDILLGSFRDPNVTDTYDVYSKIADYLENIEFTQEEFETYLIGAIGSFEKPASNNALIQTTDNNLIVGNTVEKRIKRKAEMLSTTINDLKEYANLFRKLAENASYYTIGNESKIAEFTKFDSVESL